MFTMPRAPPRTGQVRMRVCVNAAADREPAGGRCSACRARPEVIAKLSVPECPDFVTI